jgi:hypothetical protein
MRVVSLLLAFTGVASAFAPTQQKSSRQSSQLFVSFENALGAQKPLGFWYVAFDTFAAFVFRSLIVFSVNFVGIHLIFALMEIKPDLIDFDM